MSEPIKRIKYVNYPIRAAKYATKQIEIMTARGYKCIESRISLVDTNKYEVYLKFIQL